MISLLGIDPGAYIAHALHSPERAFPETNCYTDIWIELLHAQGLDPMAMLAFCTVVDFEGDQWTFFKPPPADLERLYGLEVQEFVIYRSLTDHVAEQLRLHRSVIVEVDGFHLPDTAGRSYGVAHEKTSIAIEAIDIEGKRLRYFHGLGYHELAGDDFDGALRVGPLPGNNLPPYIEFVRTDRSIPCPEDQLRDVAAELLTEHIARRPATNPVERFGHRLVADLPLLQKNGGETYHLYAFATVRQCGAAWETAATFVRWLEPRRYADAADAFDALHADAKTLLFRLARCAASGRPYDPEALLATMAVSWDTALDALAA